MGQNFYGGYDPNNFAYPAVGYNSIPMPANQNALTDEEIKTLMNTRQPGLSIAIDHKDVLRAICTHKQNGRDVVMQKNDGSGMVFCPICGTEWNPEPMEKDQVVELVRTLADQMETAKWVGDLPVDLTRELFTLMPLLKKYPDIHEYAANNFNKYYSARGMYSAADTNIYGMYNSLFTAGMPAANYAPQGYYQPAQAPAAGQGYYGQAPQGYVPNGMPANANVNPMQAPTYGVNPAAPNQQFVSQANMMMGGTVAPMYGAPAYGVPAQQAPVAAPAAAPATAPATDGATVTTEQKIDL
jgi:hypothetical protein